ncbi:putative 4-coumarate--CoA ligase 2 [Clarias magur]|uniref:Putative 4-coumarate--CoA ligase 2 n=1 Tax=Clarias magur TaxID=1594786 RepID=A0A8J4TRM9_CLAMG|nr:putative 4-coumarate--CoA ligase 2 [Clarias magur]
MASELGAGPESDSQDFSEASSWCARLRRVHLNRCEARPAGTRLLCKYSGQQLHKLKVGCGERSEARARCKDEAEVSQGAERPRLMRENIHGV